MRFACGLEIRQPFAQREIRGVTQGRTIHSSSATSRTYFLPKWE